MLKDADWVVRRAAAQALAQVAGREAIPDLRELLKDDDEDVRLETVEVLEALVAEEDLEWLVEWATHYTFAETGREINSLLIHLDRKLYCPFEWPED